MQQHPELKFESDCFYLGESREEALAIIEWRYVAEKVIDVNHTFVSESLRGQGIAQKLVEAVLELARQDNLKIIPSCSYVDKYLAKHEAECHGLRHQ